MTYGGIYRDVYIDVKPMTYIRDTFVKPLEVLTAAKRVDTSVTIELEEAGAFNHKYQHSQVMTYKDAVVYEGDKIELGVENTNSYICRDISFSLGEINLWSPEEPELYKVITKLYEDGIEIDEVEVVTAFRTAEFRTDGFYLNGIKYKIRGLNRHQSFPYVGYAMPDRPQVNDVHILKKELGVNAVRTSHYPQSQGFVDACDKEGLLVFTELRGWQHIGDDEWKDVAITSIREMVLQYRNHPSIILWGVRINESQDDDEFYTKTNKLAHELDPTRQTGGVRCFKKMNLLEDVYTYNVFVYIQEKT